MPKPKILIVEDYQKVADAIGSCCSMESMIPIVVYNGTDALNAFNANEDIAAIVLDINLPDINGFEVCRQIRAKSSVPILFMTARADEVDEVSGMEMGADGYIKKPARPRIVVAHIRAALRRNNEWAERIAKEAAEVTPPEENEPVIKMHPDFTIDEETRTIFYCKQPLDLTNIDYITLSVFIRHPGRVYSRQQIIEMVDEDDVLSLRSVDRRISRIRKKLMEINPDIDLFEVIPGVGYKLKMNF